MKRKMNDIQEILTEIAIGLSIVILALLLIVVVIGIFKK